MLGGAKLQGRLVASSLTMESNTIISYDGTYAALNEPLFFPKEVVAYLKEDFSRTGEYGKIVGNVYTAEGSVTLSGSKVKEDFEDFYQRRGTAFSYPVDKWGASFADKSKMLGKTFFDAPLPLYPDPPANLPQVESLSNKGGDLVISQSARIGLLDIEARNKTLVLDATAGDLILSIDRLNLQAQSTIEVKGDHRVYLVIDQVTGGSFFDLNNLSKDPSKVFIRSGGLLPIKNHDTPAPLYGNVFCQGMDHISYSSQQATLHRIVGSLITDAQTLTLNHGDSRLEGLLYAPLTQVTIGKKGDAVLGKIVARSLSMPEGNTKIAYSHAHTDLLVPLFDYEPEAPALFTVTTSATEGGTVQPASVQVAAGQTLTFTASPYPGYTFSHFSTSDDSMMPDANGSITVTGDVSLTAYFLPEELEGYRHGLLGVYYDTTTFDNDTALKLKRIDSQIAFNFGYTAPVEGLGSENYAIRWTGYIRPPATGDYRFKTYSDDGIRVKIGEGEEGQWVIDNWGLLSLSYSVAEETVHLQAGELIPITVEYQQLPLYAAAFLFWESDRLPQQLVPSANLFVREETYEAFKDPVPFNPLEKGGQGLHQIFYEIDEAGEIDWDTGYETTGHIYYNWGSDAPGTISTDRFYGLMTGYLEARFTEDLTLAFRVDDGVRVYFGEEGKLVIDQWDWNNQVQYSYTFQAISGEKYKLRVEYQDKGLGASISMAWESDGIAKEVVPLEYLYPPSP